MEVSHETHNEYLVHKTCPVCGSKDFGHLLRAKSYRINSEEFWVDKCDSCSHAFTNPLPNEEDIGSYYKSENYISHTNNSSSILDVVYKKVRGFALKSKERLVRKYIFNKKGTFLDYGAGTGHFVDFLYGNGWNVLGIEVSSEARSNAPERIKNALFELSYLKAINEEGLSGFSMWHVLEHVYRPQTLLKTLHGKLSTDGYGFIAVPNYQSEDARLYKENWAALDVPLHFSHFSKNSMKVLLSDTGFDCVEIINMPFDAYYISMISEKLSGKGNVLNAFYNGWRSNRLGRKSKNMSSLIYVVKRT